MSKSPEKIKVLQPEEVLTREPRIHNHQDWIDNHQERFEKRASNRFSSVEDQDSVTNDAGQLEAGKEVDLSTRISENN